MYVCISEFSVSAAGSFRYFGEPDALPSFGGRTVEVQKLSHSNLPHSADERRLTEPRQSCPGKVMLRHIAATGLGRDVVSVLNVSVSRRSRDVFWNVSSRLGLEG